MTVPPRIVTMKNVLLDIIPLSMTRRTPPAIRANRVFPGDRHITGTTRNVTQSSAFGSQRYSAPGITDLQRLPIPVPFLRAMKDRRILLHERIQEPFSYIVRSRVIQICLRMPIVVRLPPGLSGTAVFLAGNILIAIEIVGPVWTDSDPRQGRVRIVILVSCYTDLLKVIQAFHTITSPKTSVISGPFVNPCCADS